MRWKRQFAAKIMQLFIARPDQTHGPYTLEEVNRYLSAGQLAASDMAWYEGCVGWMLLSQVEGVQVPTTPTPPPPPPPPSYAPAPVAPPLQQSQQQYPSQHVATPNSSDFAGDAERTIFEVTPTLTPDLVLTVCTCGLWLLVLVPKVVTNQGYRYRLTTQRLIVSTGIAARRVEEVELYRVKDVTVQQGMLGRLLGFGDVVVHNNDASTPRLTLKSVNSPLRLKEQIREASRSSRRSEGVRTVEYGSAG